MRPFWRAEKRRDHNSEQNGTNGTPEPTLPNHYTISLSREQVLEFQDIMNRNYDADFDYKTAWIEGHRVINFYDMLLRSDNEK